MLRRRPHHRLPSDEINVDHKLFIPTIKKLQISPNITYICKSLSVCEFGSLLLNHAKTTEQILIELAGLTYRLLFILETIV